VFAKFVDSEPSQSVASVAQVDPATSTISKRLLKLKLKERAVLQAVKTAGTNPLTPVGPMKYVVPLLQPGSKERAWESGSLAQK